MSYVYDRNSLRLCEWRRQGIYIPWQMNKCSSGKEQKAATDHRQGVVCLCVCMCKLTRAYMCRGVYLCTLICIHNSMCSQLLCKEGTVIIFSKTQNWTIWLHQWVELTHDLSLSDSYSSVHYMIFLPLVCHFPKFLSESVSATLPTKRNNPNCWTDFLPRHVSSRHCQFCCLVKFH